MSKRFGVWVVVSALLAVVGPAAFGHAAETGMGGAKMTLSLTKDYTASPWTSEMGWSNRAIGKLGFGVKNALLGWTELFTEPRESLQEGGNFFAGLGMGAKNAVFDTLGGVVHTVTFPITSLDAPLPEGGVQLFSS